MNTKNMSGGLQMASIVDRYGNSLGEQADGSIIDLNGRLLTKESIDLIMDCKHKLPITPMLGEIEAAFLDNDIIVITAETGSGKSTQLPQLLSKFGILYSIQPRVPAAIGLGHRISDELLASTGNIEYSLGKNVGYRTGKGKSSSHISNISLHTDGYELRRLLYTGNIPDIIILDEFHTQSIPLVFLTYILKELKKKNQSLKIVITSATMNTQKVLEYFDDTSIPVIDVAGRTFPVETHEVSEKLLIETITKQYSQGKNLLVFQPGKKEIQDLFDILTPTIGMDNNIRILHGDMSKEEQQTAMQESTDGTASIIIATNIAEESLTIPWINAVIDTGTHKQASIDRSGYQRLDTKDISQANAQQRAGRAGRTQEGDAYRVSPMAHLDRNQYPTSPILLTSNDTEILNLISSGNDFRRMLENAKESKKSLLLEDPNTYHVELAYENLELLGAIDSDGIITEIGKEILSYPLTVNNAKILIEGIKRGATEKIIDIVALLESNSLFESTDTEMNWKKLVQGKDDDSDVFVYRNIFNILIQRKISKIQGDFLVTKGISQETIDNLKDEKGAQMLYQLMSDEEIADLGINIKHLEEILESRDTITEAVKSQGHKIHCQLQGKAVYNELKKSMLAGNLMHIFIWEPHKELFFPIGKQQTDIRFQLSSHSTLNTYNRGKTHRQGEVYYIGSPFIIGGKSNDLCFLNNITRIEGPLYENMLKEERESKQDTINTKNKVKGGRNIVKDISDFFQDGKGNSYKVPKETNMNTANFLHKHYPNSPYESAGVDELMIQKLYLLQKQLPYFIIENNHHFKKWLYKNANERFYRKKLYTFIDLLQEFLTAHVEDYLYRIHPNNKEKTNNSFEHDKDLFDTFMNEYGLYINQLITDTFQANQDFSLTDRLKNAQVIEAGASPDTIKILKSQFQNIKWQYFDIYNYGALENHIFKKYLGSPQTQDLIRHFQLCVDNYSGDIPKDIHKIFVCQNDTKRINEKISWWKGFLTELETTIHTQENAASTLAKLRMPKITSGDAILYSQQLSHLYLKENIDILHDGYADIVKKIGAYGNQSIQNKLNRSLIGLFSSDSKKYRKSKNDIEAYIQGLSKSCSGLSTEIQQLKKNNHQKRQDKNAKNIKKIPQNRISLAEKQLKMNKKHFLLLSDFFHTTVDIRDNLHDVNFSKNLVHRQGNQALTQKYIISSIAGKVLNGDYHKLTIDSKQSIDKISNRMNKNDMDLSLKPSEKINFIDALMSLDSPKESTQKSVQGVLEYTYKILKESLQVIEQEKNSNQAELHKLQYQFPLAASDKIEATNNPQTLDDVLKPLLGVVHGYYEADTYSFEQILVSTQKIATQMKHARTRDAGSIIEGEFMKMLQKVNFQNNKSCKHIFEMVDDYAYKIDFLHFLEKTHKVTIQGSNEKVQDDITQVAKTKQEIIKLKKSLETIFLQIGYSHII